MTPLQLLLVELATGGEAGTLTYTVDYFLDLTEDERGRVYGLLGDKIAEGNLKAIETAGALKEPNFIPALQLVRAAGGAAGAAAARALSSIVGGDVALLAEALDGGGLESALAASDLRALEGQDAFDLLIRALGSADLPTRANALEGLEERVAVPDEWNEHPRTPYRVLWMDVVSDLPCLRVPAALAMGQVFRELAAGVRRPEMEPEPDPPGEEELAESFRTAAREGSPAPAILEVLTGQRRRWAEDYLLYQFGRRRLLSHAVAALGLGVRGRQAVLEVVDSLDPVIQAESQRELLQTLQASGASSIKS